MVSKFGFLLLLDIVSFLETKMIKNLASVKPETQFTQPIAQRLARFAHSLNFEDIPTSVRDRANYLIVDAVGIAFAPRHYPFSGRILNSLLDAAGAGTVSVIGFQEKLPLRDAVIMNGSLIHGLDCDDTPTKRCASHGQFSKHGFRSW